MFLSQRNESESTEQDYEFVKRDIRQLEDDLKKGILVSRNVQHFYSQANIERDIQ